MTEQEQLEDWLRDVLPDLGIFGFAGTTGGEELARRILNSPVIRERDAEKWQEGQEWADKHRETGVVVNPYRKV